MFCLPLLSLGQATNITQNSSFTSIQNSINASVSGDTIIVDSGMYYEVIDFNGKAIILASNFLLSGNQMDIDLTIIDGGGAGSVVTFNSGESNLSQLIGFTIQNGNGTGINNGGGGVFINASSPTLQNLVITSNQAQWGGGMYIVQASPICINLKINDNYAIMGGGIFDDNSSPQFYNSIITSNTPSGLYIGSWSGVGNPLGNITEFNNCTFYADKIHYGYPSNEGFYTGVLKLTNSIVFDESIYGDTSNINITYSSVKGGFQGIGNIDNINFQEQSYFIDAATYDFRLTDFNPCIGAGLSVLNMKPFDINGYDRPLPLGSFPDMGAYENPLALPITGCTDPMACNYNAAVLIGDSSCNYAYNDTSIINLCFYSWNPAEFYVNEWIDDFLWFNSGFWSQTVITNSGFYTFYYPDHLTSNGCDSIVTLDLTLGTEYEPDHNDFGTVHSYCSYTWPVNGITYDSSQYVYWTDISVEGCDSMSQVHIIIDSVITVYENISTCDTYTWVDGNVYTSSNNTATYTYTNSAGCDSVVILNLTINSSSSSTDTHVACDTYTWIDGITYSASNNSATHTTTNAAGCDSIVTLDLTINQSTTSTETVISYNFYNWYGMTYTSSGLYNIIFVDTNGCDSTLYLDLTICSSQSINTDEYLCTGIPYTWPINNNVYNTAGIYYDTIINVNGCEEIYTLNLNYEGGTIIDTVSTCNSFHIDGTSSPTWTQSGVYTYTVFGAWCNTYYTIYLTINPSTISTSTQTACDSYTWNGQIITTSGSYDQTFTNVAGCDSVHTLVATINYSNTGTSSVTACDSYTWDGQTYSTSGAYANTYTNVSGCDSVHTLSLTINSSSSSSDTHVACDTYTWIDGITYGVSNNSATMIYSTVNGCDSLVTLDLTINNSTSSIDTHVACDEFMWNCDGNLYTASNNTATYTYTNAAGCDSLVTLDLTINNSTSSTDTHVACDEFMWNCDGNLYTSSNNTATYTYTNTAGCDSVVTLNLTINNSTSSIDTHVACDEFIWNCDGNLYTASNNTATYVYANVAGCDSVVTLDLTINSVLSSINQSGEVLSALTTPIALNADWYNIQTDNGETRIWLMEEGAPSFNPTFDCSYFIVVNDNGCTDTSEIYAYGENAARIGSFITSPNPTTGLINVKFDNSKNQFVMFELISNNGSKLDEFITIEDNLDIDLSKYPSGSYYLYFNSEDAVQGCRLEEVQKLSTKIILNK